MKQHSCEPVQTMIGFDSCFLVVPPFDFYFPVLDSSSKFCKNYLLSRAADTLAHSNKKVEITDGDAV